MEITIPISKDKIAIVVVGYNRIKSITRLLNSLLAAKYPDTGVPLVISVDCSGDEELYNYVQEYNWPFGDKYVNIQKTRLGLKEHIFQCGDLTKNFKAIVLLEDDLFVSPFFYHYVEKTVEFYGEEDSIAEISLYKNESNGYAGLPFFNLQNGSDTFLLQDVSTWGQCWTEQMWSKFVAWRDTHTEEDIQRVDMPQRIKGWDRAWSKYYLAYVISTGRHVIFPNISLTTNFSDAGEHGARQNSVAQVSLLQGVKQYNLRKVDELVSYDIYGNNEAIPEWLGINKDDICLDLYGIHPNPGKRYVLSMRVYPYKIIRSFALYMRPLELNIKYNIEGDGIFLYDIRIKDESKRTKGIKYSCSVMPYFSKGLRDTYVIYYSVLLFKDKLLKKLRLKK